MSASSTDKFKKGARKWVGQIGAGGVGDASVTTIPLASATNLPTDTGVVAVIDRVDSSGTKTPSLEETIIGVVSGSNLVTCVRGAEGTAQAHLAGAVVEILITNKGWNDVMDGILAEHSQAGAHTASSTTGSGVVELATTAETTTGTDAVRAVTPAGLHGMTSLSGATWMVDEDNMASNLDTKVPSQQSVKAYVDSRNTATEALSNKTIDASANTISNIANSMIVNRTRSVYTNAEQLQKSSTGSAALTESNGGNTLGWALDAAATEGVWGSFLVPADFVSAVITPTLIWSMETATSGNVVLTFQCSIIRSGSAIDSIANLVNQNQTVAVPGAADTPTTTDCTTFTPNAGDVVRFRVFRAGGDAADTAAGDLILYGLKFSYTADM